MTEKLHEITFPLHMPPQLAHVLAHQVAGTPDETEAVTLLSICFLYSSWTFKEPTSFGDYAKSWEELIKPQSPFTDSISLMTDMTVFLQARGSGVSNIDIAGAMHAASVWASQLLAMEGFDVAKVKSEILRLVATAFLESENGAFELETHMQGAIHHASLQARKKSEAQAQDVSASEQAPAMVMVRPGGGRQLVNLAQMFGQPEAPPLPPPIEVDKNKPYMQIFDPAVAKDVLRRSPPPAVPGEGNGQHRRLLEMMANDHGLRPLTETPEGAFLDEMYRDFPHFEEVLDFIKDQLALAACGTEGRIARLPPLLLRSAPGSGKTVFAEMLANALSTVFIERDLSVTTDAWVLSGMDSTYKGSKYGVVFDAIALGKTANPLICINEADKARADGAHTSPIAAFHALLEPSSSSNFKDDFAGVPVDTSRIIWVLTANEGYMPDPIAQRLEIFDIRMPNELECRNIAKSVWRKMHQQILPKGNPFPVELSEPVLERMSAISPRVMRKVLTSAAGSAAGQGRYTLELGDIGKAQRRYTKNQGQPIGFV